MFVKVEIVAENAQDIQKLADTMRALGLEPEKTYTEVAPEEKVEKKSKAVTKAAPAVNPPPAPAPAPAPEPTPDQEPIPEEVEVEEVTVAMCRAIATQAIQKNLTNEVNAIVKAAGAPALSKLPAEKLADVYAELKALVQ